ncbi:hypothetical protein ACX80D_13885 [Arthrobacter sp. Sr24]
MPGDAIFYAPIGYSVWWPLLGAALLILCAGTVAWIWIATKSRTNTAVPIFVAPRNTSSVKRKYWSLIDDIQHRYDAGQLDGRAAHLELSLVVRTFVHEMTGLQTQRMTLAQLREHRLPLAADAVEQFYPAEFSRVSQNYSFPESAQTAREVVARWN